MCVYVGASFAVTVCILFSLTACVRRRVLLLCIQINNFKEFDEPSLLIHMIIFKLKRNIFTDLNSCMMMMMMMVVMVRNIKQKEEII
jgi:hypothetical protein